MEKKEYKYKNVEVVLEKESHFSSDKFGYFLIIKIDGKDFYLKVSGGQYVAMYTSGIPAYRNEKMPEEHIIEEIKPPMFP